MRKNVIVLTSVFLLLFLVLLILTFKFLKPEYLLASLLGDRISVSQKDILSLKDEIEMLKEKINNYQNYNDLLDDMAEEREILRQGFLTLESKIKEMEKKLTESERNESKAKDEEERESEQEISWCSPLTSVAPLMNKIIINEVAWMGTLVSSDNEWIELKNITAKEINLEGWQLQDKDQQIKIIFSKKDVISPNGFYLLERSKEETVPAVQSDKIYTGRLSNKDEALYLFGPDCQLEDKVEAFPSWPAGDNFSKKTMERKGDFSWQTSQEGGTPKKENSQGELVITSFSSVVSGSGGGSSAPLPVLELSFPATVIPTNEIKISLKASFLNRIFYDIKISIEKDDVLSEIYNEKEQKWQDSYLYLSSVAQGDSFEEEFTLRIKASKKEIRGETDLIVKIRETDSKKVVLEQKRNITIIDPPLFSFTILVNGQGFTDPLPGTYQCKEGEEVVIKALAEQGWKFKEWTATIPAEVENSEISFICGETEQTIFANFEEEQQVPQTKNLLLNEFFQEWEDNKPKYWTMDYSVSSIKKSDDALVGDASFNIFHNFKYAEGKNNDQEFTHLEADGSEVIYYAQIWVRGYGDLRIGIRRPGYNTYEYSNWQTIDTQEWEKIDYQVTKDKREGEKGSFRIQHRRSEGKENTNLLIGAVWLGVAPPSSDWPRGER